MTYRLLGLCGIELMAKAMGKHTNASPTPRSLPLRQIDLRDWRVLGDAARELAVAAGRKHRQHFTIISEALTWRSLQARMRAAGLHELHDAPIFRAAKMVYLQTE